MTVRALIPAQQPEVDKIRSATHLQGAVILLEKRTGEEIGGVIIPAIADEHGDLWETTFGPFAYLAQRNPSTDDADHLAPGVDAAAAARAAKFPLDPTVQAVVMLEGPTAYRVPRVLHGWCGKRRSPFTVKRADLLGWLEEGRSSDKPIKRRIRATVDVPY